MLGFFCLQPSLDKQIKMQFCTKQYITFTIGLFLLSGCTQKFNDTFSTVNASIEGLSDVELSAAELIEFPYDSAYVRFNNGRKILMVLALAEINPLNNYQTLKWLSADNVMLVTENGRIVKTLGFDNNLIGIKSTSGQLPSPSTQTSWQAYYDWMPAYRYQFTAQTNSKVIGQEEVILSKWSLSTKYVQETIHFVELDSKITNHYWLNSNKKTVKTIQYIGPNMDKIEISFVKDFTSNNH